MRGRSIRQKYGYMPRLGGLGGTLMDGSERGLGYEGIDLNDEVVCKRKPTVQKLQQALSDKGVIFVRAPPMAEFQGQKRRVFQLSLLWMKREGELWDFAGRFGWLFGGLSWDEFIEECNSISTVLIVDEVQMLYRPEGEAKALHDGDIFWNTFKSMQQSRRLQIVAFAVYGYRGVYDGNAETGNIMDGFPYRLHQSHIWSLENVRFTEEFYDYFRRFCKLSLKDVDVLGCYVSEVTLLHPGLVAYTMNTIYKRFLPQLKEGKEALTFEKIYIYLSSYGFREYIRSTRAAPRLSYMDSDEIHLVDTVLFRPRRIIVHPEGVPNNGRLINTSILIPSQSHNMQGNILDFSAPLLRAIYLQGRLGATQCAHIPPKSFQDFIKFVFTAMRPETFRMTLSIGCDGRLLERIWQMEFYRSATQILPIDVYISPDVGAVFGTGGYVDFYVNDGRDWAIELLRDGEDLRSHQERFTEMGERICYHRY
ncbi:7931_t:CDS:2 [Paraglomus occultum]|uniref:7931_t:CDS:1 n=1 Tax=Paraglomus occultum TaxID=144539 RepID=A0A9N8ZPV7_9GLOM|nr:7931_t:CDS:2 [Paraglomus occultum]